MALRSCGGGSAGHFVTFITQVGHIREFKQGQILRQRECFIKM